MIKNKSEKLSEAVAKVREDLQKQDEKPSISQVKKKLGVGKKKTKFVKKID